MQIKIGDIVAEGWEEYNSFANPDAMPVYGGTTIEPAQSFYVPYTDSTFQGISLYLYKYGSPATDLTITIEGDSGGHPDGTPVATFTITPAMVAGSYDWVTAHSAYPITLYANKKYWIRAYTSGGDSSNYYGWYHFTGGAATYKKGYVSTSQYPLS